MSLKASEWGSWVNWDVPVFLEMTGSWGASPETACVRAELRWAGRGTYLRRASSQSLPVAVCINR